MMRAAVLIFALVPTFASAEATSDPATPKPACVASGATTVAGKATPPGAQRLDQLPPANAYLTVIHAENGCIKPVILHYDVDGRAHPR